MRLLSGLCGLAALARALAAAPTTAAPPAVTRRPVAAGTGAGGVISAATAVRGVFYLLPARGGSHALTTYDPAAGWGTIPVPASVPVMDMLDGPSFTGVEAVHAGLDDFVVVSGGGTNHVVYYNVRTKTWAAAPPMRNAQKNACATSCRGFWYSMTGDMAKQAGEERAEHDDDDDDDDDEGMRKPQGILKPQDRQVYRYNFTSGEHFENSGKKQRGGAGCGCDPLANRVIWEGGSSNSGLSDNVECWGADPLHRGGEPIFKATGARRDVGAVACGGLFVGVGGSNSKQHALSSVDVFTANSSDPSGGHVALDLGVAVTKPRVACLAGRFVLVSGGHVDGGKAVDTTVHVLDTHASPLAFGVLPGGVLANVTGEVFAATDVQSGSVLFFDGKVGELMTLSN